METKYTKGEWELMPQPQGSGLTMIVTCTSKKEKIYTCIETISYETEEEKANAHLMAAAPELLSALEAVANGMMQTQGFIPNFMKSAINKARNKND